MDICKISNKWFENDCLELIAPFHLFIAQFLFAYSVSSEQDI